jgi:hypothetical protein
MSIEKFLIASRFYPEAYRVKRGHDMPLFYSASPDPSVSSEVITRACPQLSKMIAAAKWIPARKFLAVLS